MTPWPISIFSIFQRPFSYTLTFSILTFCDAYDIYSCLGTNWVRGIHARETCAHQ